MILADTSVWVDHLRNRNPAMELYLTQGLITMHPYIAAELSLGSLRRRAKTLADLDALLETRLASLQEVRHMIVSRALYSRGIGLTDAYLLASCLITPGTRLWTLDRSMQAVAATLGIVFDPAPNST